MAAILLVAMVGMMALTLEGGSIMAERRRAQAVADAAAVAAACDLTYNYGFSSGQDTSGSALASALTVAAASGYANDGTTSTVSVNIPPKSGDYLGKSGYAEVLVTYNQPRGLSAIFGSGSITMTARSVARGQWSTYPVAFLALEPALPASMTIALNANLTVVNGAVDIDSTSLLSTVVALSGRISAPTINLSGGALTLLNGPIVGTVNTGVTPTPDPLSYLHAPDPATLVVRRTALLNIASLQTTTLQPGVYYGGIHIAASANVTMTPGIYYMAGGGFAVAASPLISGSLIGNGVTIINAPILATDIVAIAAVGTVQLTPPTTGLYAGITIMQPPELIPLPLGLGPPLTIGGNSLFGSSIAISGTIYAPQSDMVLAGNGSAKVGSQVICRTATIAANSSVSIAWDSNTSRMPLPVKLVE